MEIWETFQALGTHSSSLPTSVFFCLSEETQMGERSDKSRGVEELFRTAQKSQGGQGMKGSTGHKWLMAWKEHWTGQE